MQIQIPRRKFLKALSLAAADLAAPAENNASQARSGSSGTLVAYFSRTGNTKLIARQIRGARGATLFEINPGNPYPEDYVETVAQASQETGAGYLPPLKTSVADVRRYDTIYLGFPIWGMTAPPVVRSFLRGHDLSGKIIHPFITHGGYGLGDSIDIVRSIAPGADVRPAFSMEADQERRTLEQVTGWLSG
ncbi:flavodoxin (plasmid) [Rhizobium sullae]|uniref:Flavodoxin n=1 Tax=Rhizobium sullae TaxID=50338 RepID=A0A2N0DEK7_RHISU|nr:flavodoxin [Rhizobium sullae]PKA44539.1 flavodoxin [Rhizobium sullae]UWU17949.1 flavodoxin [Rhizobium sullae]